MQRAGRAAPLDENSAGFSLRDGLQLVFKHGAVIAGCTALVTALVWTGAAMQPKSYEGAAKLWIKTEQQPMPSFLSGIAAYRDSVAVDPANRKIETEIELLLSRDSAERVVRRLQVRPEQLARPPLDAVIGPLTQRVRELLHRPAKPLTLDEAQAQQQGLVDSFLKAFSVENQRSKGADTTSNVLEIRFGAADPELVPVAIKALVDEYIQLAAQQNRRLGEASFQLLESKAQEARADLAQSEQELLNFMASQGERASRAAPRGATASGFGSVGGGEALPGGTSVVGMLKSQAADMQHRLDDLRQIYTEEAANVRALSRSIDTLQQRIKREVRANAEADAQLSMLERQRSLAQERFVELQKRLDQIDLYLRVNPTEAESRVLTQSPERPTKPETKRLLIVRLLGPLGGLLLGLALAGLREMFDRRLQSPDELTRSLGLEVLSALPALPQRQVTAGRWAAGRARLKSRGTGGQASSTGGPSTTGLGEAAGVALLPGESLRELVPVVPAQVASDRSLLMHRLALRVRDLVESRATTKGMGRVLLVTSARAGEGKSVIARALAKRLAVQGHGQVLLIDASAEAPAGHGGQRVRGRPGFFDILREREVMAEVSASRDTPKLQSLGVGFDPDPSLLYHEAAVAELFNKVRERYDWTVVDAGTLTQIGSLATQCDATLVVVDAQTTRREVVQGALSIARIPAQRLLGAVLNRRPQYVPGWVYRVLL
jgi:uncharacterized protein involved in exopolysaccharide biosynthesis/Mrp family chromosome partitioning ATPase